MRSVVDRNVVMRRMTVYFVLSLHKMAETCNWGTTNICVRREVCVLIDIDNITHRHDNHLIQCEYGALAE